jgi:alpha-1,2-mannosyltransferase
MVPLPSTMRGVNTGPKQLPWRALGWAVWLAPLLVISIVSVLKPEDHTVTPVYHEAVENWRLHLPLYNHKFYYAPQFALFFAPFHYLPRAVGDILWRCLATAGLGVGVLLFCESMSWQNRDRAFFIVTLLAMPLCLQAMQLGQANEHLAAALLLAAWCLSARRWWAATMLLWLATAIKPLGIAAVGLAWAAYPHLWWRLALGLPVFFIVPFAFGPSGYIWSQLIACAENLRQSTGVAEHRFADLNGLLRTFGTPVTGRASLAMRAIAGGLFMLLCRQASRRHPEPLRALVWLGAAGVFLMLFNPMTEANSYAIVAPVFGLLAWWDFTRGEKAIGWLLATMVLSMGLLPEPLRPWLGNYFSLAWYPAGALAFLALLGWMAFSPRSPDVNPVAAGSAPLRTDL